MNFLKQDILLYIALIDKIFLIANTFNYGKHNAGCLYFYTYSRLYILNHKFFSRVHIFIINLNF